MIACTTLWFNNKLFCVRWNGSSNRFLGFHSKGLPKCSMEVVLCGIGLTFMKYDKQIFPQGREVEPEGLHDGVKELVLWKRTMPVSCFSSTSNSAPASQSTCMSKENGSCFGALFKACKRSRSVSWDVSGTDEFEKNPHFKKTSEDEFRKLYKVKKTIGAGGQSPQW